MTNIIKSGLFIEGVEVTSEHIGQEVVLHRDVWDLQKDGQNIITAVRGEDFRVSWFEDNSTDFNWVDDCDVDVISNWKWKDRSIVSKTQPTKPHIKTTATQRKKLAKEIREAEKLLKQAIANAQECGIIVSGYKDLVVEFYPEKEVY